MMGKTRLLEQLAHAERLVAERERRLSRAQDAAVIDIHNTVLAAQRSGFEFLCSDAELAMVLLERAAGTRDSAVKTRNIKNAISAYRTIHRLAKRAHLNSRQRTKVDEALAALRSRLRAMLQAS
jgi:hypothetical protein